MVQRRRQWRSLRHTAAATGHRNSGFKLHSSSITTLPLHSSPPSPPSSAFRRACSFSLFNQIIQMKHGTYWQTHGRSRRKERIMARKLLNTATTINRRTTKIELLIIIFIWFYYFEFDASEGRKEKTGKWKRARRLLLSTENLKNKRIRTNQPTNRTRHFSLSHPRFCTKRKTLRFFPTRESFFDSCTRLASFTPVILSELWGGYCL